MSYRTEDYDIIKSNLEKISDKARNIINTTYEVTDKEFKEVMNHIKDYIRKEKKIVYGGYAQNILIKEQNKKDAFYKENGRDDIEFYSTEPVKDLINLCDYLHKKKYKYVEGSEGVHSNTYNLFVNFQLYCDISYLPPKIYNNCSVMLVDNMKIIHPHFMMIDAYRVYTDIYSIEFRLSKTFDRMSKLEKYYPFDENASYNKIEYEIKLKEKEYNTIFRFIRKSIIHNSNFIVIGHYAFNRLMKHSDYEKFMIHEPFYTLISIDFKTDSDKIYHKLKKQFSNRISSKRYYKFNDFADESIEYYYNNQIILRIYGNNHRCIPYNYSPKKKTKFGTSQIIMLYLLINYQLAVIRKNNFNKVVYMTMITRLLKARNKYLDDNNKTILDKSSFQEFTLECIGEPENILRESRLARKEKKRKKIQPIVFRYTPKDNSPGKVPVFRYDNISGDEKQRR